MKLLSGLYVFTLLLFLVFSGSVYAQDQDKKAQEETKQQNNEKAKQEDKSVKPEEGKQQEEPNARHDEHQNRREAGRPEEQQPRDERHSQEQRPENQRRGDHNMGQDRNQHPAAGRGKHIPDDQFRTHFGRQHTFHVQRSQIVNVSQPVVVYGGYSFELIDAWPADWSYDDDCYVDYVDGEYFLFDALHPGLRIVVVVIE